MQQTQQTQLTQATQRLKLKHRSGFYSCVAYVASAALRPLRTECHLPYGITHCYLHATRHRWTRSAPSTTTLALQANGPVLDLLTPEGWMQPPDPESNPRPRYCKSNVLTLSNYLYVVFVQAYDRVLCRVVHKDSGLECYVPGTVLALPCRPDNNFFTVKLYTERWVRRLLHFCQLVDIDLLHNWLDYSLLVCNLLTICSRLSICCEMFYAENVCCRNALRHFSRIWHGLEIRGDYVYNKKFKMFCAKILLKYFKPALRLLLKSWLCSTIVEMEIELNSNRTHRTRTLFFIKMNRTDYRSLT